MLWIAIAPFLIYDAIRLLNNFFIDHKNIFKKEKEWEELYTLELKRIHQSKYLIFGIPWGIITSLIILIILFQEAPLLIQIWVFTSFFILFLLSSIGFQGVNILIKTIDDICASNIIFYPYHPDKFGGISDFGRFSVKGAIYFSSGALLFPLAFEIMHNIEENFNFSLIILFLLASLFIITMFSSFFIPIFRIKRFADLEKERIIIESRKKLNKMIMKFKKNDNFDIKEVIEIIIHYYINHRNLLKMKDYPWDFRILIEFGASFIIPILVVLLEIYFK